MLSTDK